MALYDKFPPLTEGLIQALDEHFPDKLPPYDPAAPVAPHTIAYQQGARSVVLKLRDVLERQKEKKERSGNVST